MRRSTILLAGLWLATAAPPVAADLIVVPPALANATGGLGSPSPFAFPTSTGTHTQIAYDASLFAGVSGPIQITAIQFRPIDPTGGFFGDTLTVSNALIRLSTTPRSDETRSPLSAAFADNLGPDLTTVFSGPLSLTTRSTDLPDGTKAFDYVINLQTPFVYDPSAGNLLLDTVVPAGETIRGNGFFGAFPRFDTANRLGDGLFQIFSGNSATAATGVVGTSGPVTRFEFTPAGQAAAVPAPPGLAVLACGAAGLAVVRRRRARPGTVGDRPPITAARRTA